MKKLDLDRFENKIDSIHDRLGSIDVTLAKQSVILDEHVKRTNLLEQKLEPVETYIKTIKSVVKIISFIGMGVIIKIIHALVTK
jgi:archaellum component FlaC